MFRQTLTKDVYELHRSGWDWLASPGTTRRTRFIFPELAEEVKAGIRLEASHDDRGKKDRLRQLEVIARPPVVIP